jgi:hypothetical protein
MGNTTTHIQYTTSNNSSTPRPSTPPARAGVAQRRRARRATAAVRGRRAGRHQSVGAVGLAAGGVLCAHAQRLALVRAAAQTDASGRGRRRVYSDQVWTPQEKWRERTGWRRVALTVRGRAVRVSVQVLGPCRRLRWGERVFCVIVVRGHRKRAKREKSREPMAFWVHAVRDGTGRWRLPVSLEGLLLKLWQRWEMEVGFRWMKSGFGLGEKPCWGLDSGERSVAWSAWVYGALVWSGYRAWGGWTGGARWGGGPCVRWSFRDVLWSVRGELLGIDGGLWGGGVCGDEVPKNGGVGWCWDVDVVLSWLCAFRL